MTFKQKWDNYWYHYKWATLAALFGILLLFVGIKSFTDKKEPDLFMVYMSNSMVSEKDVNAFKADLINDGVVKDVDGDSNTFVHMEHIVSTFDVNDPIDQGTAAKVQTVLYGGQQTLMLVHQYALEDYDGMFEDLSDRVKEGDKTFNSPAEKFICGISVEGNEYLESHGINTENLYIAMRRRTLESIEKGKDKEYFDQAYKTMEYILSHQR